MANLQKAVPENVPGEFFVDDTCIDCDTCRQLAPATFDDAGEYSYVRRQPGEPGQVHQALQALLSCPTGSIGTVNPNQAKAVMADFPILIEDGVYYCGFNSPKSYGGSSYVVTHPDGNWLVDSPKYLPNLVRQFEAMGGIKWIFLTHSDDVGDADRYAAHFGAKRMIHREELWSQPDSEHVIEGEAPVAIHPEFVVYPTPGHTRGHCVLLYGNRFLFTGDHMWWDRDEKRLANPRHYYWSRAEMARSNRKLDELTFEWVLPGHGQRIHLPAVTMHQEMQRLISG